MLTLFHHPFCPHSRYVRLILAEYGIRARLLEERFWERREEFLLLNPAGETRCWWPRARRRCPARRSSPNIIDETRRRSAARTGCCRRRPRERVEVRRLASWFNDKFYTEVSGPLVNERVYKRHMPVGPGRRPARHRGDARRAHNIRYHLAYIGWLVRTRDWLAGDRLSLADLAAAAHLSAVDYLGDVPWNEDEAAKNWYARMKSRPSFRAMLADTLAGLPPAPTLRQPRLLTRSRANSRLRSSNTRRRAASTSPASPSPMRYRKREARLRAFLADGAHGDMGWMASDRRTARRARRRCGRTCARSIMLGMNYGPDHDPLAILTARGRAARFRSMPRATIITT